MSATSSLLSPKDLARAIGVSESSVKRWADEGVIRASRTAGGHRRIPIAEAVRFIRATEATVVQPEVLGLRDVEAVSPDERSADNPDAFLRFLEEGDGERVRGFLIARYLGGESIAELFDRRIRPAMETIGAVPTSG